MARALRALADLAEAGTPGPNPLSPILVESADTLEGLLLVVGMLERENDRLVEENAVLRSNVLRSLG